MGIQFHYGFTPKFWGVELSADCYLDVGLTVRIGPLWVSLEMWRK